MMTKLQEGYYFLLVLLDAVGMAWARTKRTLRNLEDIFKMNIEKLRARYPDGFDADHSLHRQPGDI